MRKTFTLFFSLFLFSVMAFSQSDAKIKEVKDEIRELRKQGDSQMKLFNDGSYCKNYFSEWSDFRFKPLRSYLPPKTSAEADALANKAEEDVKFLEDLKSNYLRPNGAFYQYQTDYKKVLETKEKIRQLEKDINEYPYPLVWAERAACSNVIDMINDKIRNYKNEAKSLRGLSAELSDATDFSETNKANNDNSNTVSQSKSGQQLELSSGTNNNYLDTTSTSNHNSQESPAEKAARLDRERGAEIMQETQDRVASVKTSSQQLGNAVSQISNSIVSGLQERDRRKAIESKKKERAYQNAVAKRDNDIAAIAKKQSLITDEKMASLKKAEFANWNSYKLSQNINNLINLRRLTLRNYKSKSLPKDIEKLVNLESLTLDLYSTGDITSDLLNGGSFTLNSEIKELSNLNNITFIGNGYLTNINIDSSVFDELDNLETFSVYSKYLKSLPQSLLDSKYVEKIELYYHPKNRKNANNDQLKKDLKYIKSKTCLVVKFQDGTKPIFGKKCD